MERISSILSHIVQDLGLEKELERKMAVSIWPQIAKEVGIKGAEVLYIKGKILWIAVKSAGKRQEIMMKKSRILNAYKSRGVIFNDIKFVRERRK